MIRAEAIRAAVAEAGGWTHVRRAIGLATWAPAKTATSDHVGSQNSMRTDYPMGYTATVDAIDAACSNR